ncbi:protein of unknown function DUF1361 [Crinalium epipsammum PCC 9333]|uniref:DUF1361 domain-containing protein n=1 Tax=Crinalium epipsammum PCC 9333 TaxID=1173022 RepID=K9VYA9_9CYAN|nr:DUF1361 domain-containing protein [Crinalium epipsammum]AFZ12135.1 protein of unknown function DUF1361 [Crinalium epipsammum PCC 9333]
MTDQLSAVATHALHLWYNNLFWMAWNLFLALVPLGMSFWLFHRPRSLWLRVVIGIMLGATFVYGFPRKDNYWENLIKLINSLSTSYLAFDAIYLILVVGLILLLMMLDFRLLHGRGSRSIAWWLGFAVFILFLPNAPYVLTDIIHLIDDIRRYSSVWLITLAIIPEYLLFMVMGFESYVLSLIYLGDYLKRHGWGKYLLSVELIVHGLSAIGVYLGRFQRLNSWHIISQPDELFRSVTNDLVGKLPLVVIAVTFVVIAGLYWIMKQVSLGIMLKSSRRSVISTQQSAETTDNL